MVLGNINFITIRYCHINYLLEECYRENIIKNVVERTKNLLKHINNNIIKIIIIIHYNDDLSKTIEFNRNISDNISYYNFRLYFKYELKIYLNKKKCNELKVYKRLLEYIINNLDDLSYIKTMINYLKEKKSKLYHHEYVFTSDDIQFKIIDEKKNDNNIYICLEEVINNLYKFINSHFNCKYGQLYIFSKFESCYNEQSLYSLINSLNY